MKGVALGVGLSLLSMTASADFLGLTTARTANVDPQPQLTVDAGLNFGNDATVIGGLAAYKLSSSTLLTGTVGMLDLDNGGDDIVFGGGVIHQLDNSPFPNMDVAVRGLLNLWDAGAVDVTEIGVEVVMSPFEQTLIPGAQVYGYAGIHQLKFNYSRSIFGSVSDTEIALGGGAIKAMANGEGYALIELLDGLSVGVGYRMALGG